MAEITTADLSHWKDDETYDIESTAVAAVLNGLLARIEALESRRYPCRCPLATNE